MGCRHNQSRQADPIERAASAGCGDDPCRGRIRWHLSRPLCRPERDNDIIDLSSGQQRSATDTTLIASWRDFQLRRAASGVKLAAIASPRRATRKSFCALRIRPTASTVLIAGCVRDQDVRTGPLSGAIGWVRLCSTRSRRCPDVRFGNQAASADRRVRPRSGSARSSPSGPRCRPHRIPQRFRGAPGHYLLAQDGAGHLILESFSAEIGFGRRAKTEGVLRNFANC